MFIKICNYQLYKRHEKPENITEEIVKICFCYHKERSMASLFCPVIGSQQATWSCDAIVLSQCDQGSADKQLQELDDQVNLIKVTDVNKPSRHCKIYNALWEICPF